MVCGLYRYSGDVYAGGNGDMKDIIYAVLITLSMAIVVYYIIKYQHLGFTLSSIIT